MVAELGIPEEAVLEMSETNPDGKTFEEEDDVISGLSLSDDDSLIDSIDTEDVDDSEEDPIEAAEAAEKAAENAGERMMKGRLGILFYLDT